MLIVCVCKCVWVFECERVINDDDDDDDDDLTIRDGETLGGRLYFILFLIFILQLCEHQ